VSHATWVVLGAGAVVLVALLWAEATGQPVVRGLAKATCSLCFVLVAVAGGLHGRYASLVLAALLLSAVGDVLLLSWTERAFVGGLASFLLAHVAYATAFAPISAAPPVVPLLVVAVLAGVVAWLWPRLGAMRVPVLAYCVAIGAMLWLALGVASPLVRLGAVLFCLSDLFVARGRFVRPGKVNQLVGWPLYYAGQFLLALSAG
jgi:uncharacterized membrane protein YhhN